jgi:hypothetical protein
VVRPLTQPRVLDRAVVDDHDALLAYGIPGFRRDQELKIGVTNSPTFVDLPRRGVAQTRVHGPFAQACWQLVQQLHVAAPLRVNLEREAVEEVVINDRQAELARRTAARFQPNSGG